jgi:acetate kinase
MLDDFFATRPAGGIDACAHRVVHGGASLVAPMPVDEAVEREIERLAALAPLHNPVALRWIRACRGWFAGSAQIAVFDTAFFAALPEVARRYAIPRAPAERLGLRRFGFHGLAHAAMWRRWCALQPGSGGRGQLISLQLGAGCSIAAIADGAPRDTSMGFSPLEGLMMATRSGDVDPGLLLYWQRAEGLGPADMETLLNEACGLLGVSGISADMRALLDSPEPAARLAVEMYCYRARKYLGGYLAVLNGADAIAFGGGVGENAHAVRARILDGMQWAGIHVDAAANASAQPPARISAPDSRVAVWVIPVDESALLAEEAAALLSGRKPR